MLSDPAASWFAALVLTGCSFLNSTPSLDVYSITLFVDLHVYGQRNSCMSPGGPGEHIVSEQQFSSLQGLGTHPAIKWSSSPFVFVTMANYSKILGPNERKPYLQEQKHKTLLLWNGGNIFFCLWGQFSFPEIKSHHADRADFKVLSSRTPGSHPAQPLDCKPQHSTQWSELSGVSAPWTAFGVLGAGLLSTYLWSPVCSRGRETESRQAAQRVRQILSPGYCRKTGWQAGILTGAVSNSNMKCSPERDSSHPSPSEQYKLVVHSQEADWGCSLPTCLSCLSQPRCTCPTPEACTTSSPLQTSQPFSSLSILEVWLSIIQNQTLAFLKVRMEI